MKGTIIKGIGGFYYIDTENGVTNAVQEENSVRKKLRLLLAIMLKYPLLMTAKKQEVLTRLCREKI